MTAYRSHRLAARTAAFSAALALSLFSGLAAAQTTTPPAPDPQAAAAGTAHAFDLSAAFQKVAHDVTPAVVNIAAKSGRVAPARSPQEFLRRREQPEAYEATSFGSGIIVSADGYILTNNHVVENARELTVNVNNGQQYTAKLIGRDPDTDVALIKIDAKGLPFAKLGDSDNAQVGEWVVAIGNPYELGNTVTAGIISAKGRVGISNSGNAFEDFLQTDAAINPGNSGGPLVNLHGEVIGINTAIFSRSGGYQGIGFCVPANMAKGVMDSLIATGKVERGYLGIEFNSQSMIDAKTAKAHHFEGTEGVVVENVRPDGPAAKAGLKPGDIITALDGKTIANGNALRTHVAVLAPGHKVNLEVSRDGQTKKFQVTLGQLPGDAVAASTDTNNVLGVAVGPLTPEAAGNLNLRSTARGVLVTDVDANSDVAQKIGLEAGDVILSINGRHTASVADYLAAAKMANLAKGISVRFVNEDGVQDITVRSTTN